MRILAMALIALMASGPSPASESAATDFSEKLFAKCPGAAREAAEIETRMKPAHPPPKPARPALRENLLLMARQDQEARAFLLSSGGRFDPQSPQASWMNKVDAANRQRLKHIVSQEGFPTARMVGMDGVDSAWMLSIHAGSDPDFQENVLKLTTGHVRRGEVRGDQVAALTDDLLMGRGKRQRYGTNFELRDGEFKPSPLEDEAQVEELRRKVGLGSLANYACIMRAMYGAPELQPANPSPTTR
ncbi:MAG TPA: DUF6624 domain-containing protein [Steroidobacteraceae bacterium]|jgi:hypothetical protein|nr:DUF6624 domain-containing protein [Steroidobacteraceae bacterium]